MNAPSNTTLPGQEHFVAPVDETPLQAVDSVDTTSAPAGMYREAWRQLRKNPLFIIAAILILFILFVAAFPQVLASRDLLACNIQNSLGARAEGHPFGFDQQGCDVYARVVYGTRPSVLVGIGTTIFVVIIGGIIGALAGYLGGWLDAVLSRVTDIFFAIPMLLGAIVYNAIVGDRTVFSMIVVLSIFGWTSIARIMRGSVLSLKNSEFVTASTALGSGNIRNLARHIVPNAMAPVIVTATVNLGTYIVAEATLSFLGVGLDNVVSWGVDISTAQKLLRSGHLILFYPSAALAVTVLSFIMLGDAVRDALDPKARKR